MTTDSSSFSIAKEKLSNTSSKGAIGCATVPDPTPSCAEYFSTRILSIMESRSKFGSTLESEIEASKEHWSEVWSEDDEGESSEDEGCSQKTRRIGERNLVLYESLQMQYEFGDSKEDFGGRAKGFFKDWNDKFHKLGEKIAEGGQAEIFKLEFLDPKCAHENEQSVLEVLKPGSRLQALQKQWPESMLLKVKDPEKPYFAIEGCSGIVSGMMFKDGRFAFWMMRFWGDLRKVIDLRMEHNGNKAPLFTDVTAFKIMFSIAKAMRELHKDNILHRDLKAANVLIGPYMWKVDAASQRIDDALRHGFNPIKDDDFQPIVADFECPGGVVETQFWRAPEILLGVKNEEVPSSLYRYGYN